MTNPRRSLTGLAFCAVALGLGFNASPAVGQEQGEAPHAEAPEAEREGIQVQGHWVLRILNPDGTLDRRIEFHNELVPTGAEALARTMARGRTVGVYWVTFGTNDGPCGGDPCFIAETDLDFLSGESRNLTVSRSDSSFTLEGDETADDDGSIEFVNTNVGTCASSTAPDDCQEDVNFVFTQRTLSETVSVSSGQTVDVTVEILFN